MTLTGPIAQADELNDEFDAIRDLALDGTDDVGKDHLRWRRIGYTTASTLTSATALSLRTLTFTPMVGEEVRVLYARGTADAASRTLTVTLEQADGGTGYLLDKTFTASVTSAAAATYDTRPTSLDLRTVTGDRVRLIAGVRYRVTVATDAGAWSNCHFGVQVRERRNKS